MKLTYTEEMKEQDELWERKNEDLVLMKKLQKDIEIEAKQKGFTGEVICYEVDKEIISEVYKSAEELALVQYGKLVLFNNVCGHCESLIRIIEKIMNQNNLQESV